MEPLVMLGKEHIFNPTERSRRGPYKPSKATRRKQEQCRDLCGLSYGTPRRVERANTIAEAETMEQQKRMMNNGK